LSCAPAWRPSPCRCRSLLQLGLPVQHDLDAGRRLAGVGRLGAQEAAPVGRHIIARDGIDAGDAGAMVGRRRTPAVGVEPDVTVGTISLSV
jgi:hypothetical protein